ncbi:MAG TPA: hypothetical protein VK658_11495 [Chryseolinea sp.]|nr:hypothetical protein [Chryseolinea sp.]
MKIERLITVFDNDTERLKEEINIDSIDLEQLKGMFSPPSNDPLMYNVYEIQADHVSTINELLEKKIEFDFKASTYYVECVQLPPYDFGKKS